MNINFEYNGVKASNRLEIFAARKVEKLFDKYQFIIRADVLISTENTSNPETGKICKIRLSAPGPRLFAEDNNASFEAAIAATTTELEKQLKKKKYKMSSH